MQVVLAILYPPGHRPMDFYAERARESRGGRLMLEGVRAPKRNAMPPGEMLGIVREGHVVISGMSYLLRRVDAPEWWNK